MEVWIIVNVKAKHVKIQYVLLSDFLSLFKKTKRLPNQAGISVNVVGTNSKGKSIAKNFIKSIGSSDCQYMAWLNPILSIFPTNAPMAIMAIIDIIFFIISFIWYRFFIELFENKFWC